MRAPLNRRDATSAEKTTGEKILLEMRDSALLHCDERSTAMPQPNGRPTESWRPKTESGLADHQRRGRMNLLLMILSRHDSVSSPRGRSASCNSCNLSNLFNASAPPVPRWIPCGMQGDIRRRPRCGQGLTAWMEPLESHDFCFPSSRLCCSHPMAEFRLNLGSRSR
jgi:hypothetical protein